MFESRFAWGEVQLCLDVKNGAVQRAAIFSDAMEADVIKDAAKGLEGVKASGEDISCAIASSAAGEQEKSKEMLGELCAWIRSIM